MLKMAEGLLCSALELLSHDQVIFIKAFKLVGDSETRYTIPRVGQL